MNSELLRTFIAVATHGNVTHAALALHKTQSAVSVQVKRLEASLDVQLFERGARGVTLTDAGVKFLRTATPIIEQLDQAQAMFNDKQMGGQVRVGIPDEYGETILPAILAGFSRIHRGVEVSVRCEFSVDFPEAIRRGELDLALFACQEPLPGHEVLRVEQTVWAAHASNSVYREESIPLALFDCSCWWRDVALNALESAGTDYRIAYTSQSVAGIKAAISAGLAVGVLARSSVDESMRVLKRKDGFPDLPRSSLVMIQESKEPSLAVAAMADAIRVRLGKSS